MEPFPFWKKLAIFLIIFPIVITIEIVCTVGCGIYDCIDNLKTFWIDWWEVGQ